MNESTPPETSLEPAAPAEKLNLAAALDGLLFVHNRPIPFDRLGELLNLSQEEIEALVLKRKQCLDADPDRGLQIIITESGVQMATKACISQVIQRLEGQKLVSLSLPALEALSVIAFKQPITKAEIEAIRGVNCDGVITTLLEKKLVYVSGEKPVIGRPRLYSTTQDFLYYFGMKTLRELPVPALDIPDGAILGPLPTAEEIAETVPGSVPGTIPGSVSGSIPEPTPEPTPGSVPGHIPGSIPGAPVADDAAPESGLSATGNEPHQTTNGDNPS